MKPVKICVGVFILLALLTVPTCSFVHPAYASIYQPVTLPSTMALSVAPQPEAIPAPKIENKEESKKSTDSWWKVLLGGILEVLLLFLSALASALGVLLVRWFARKLKVTDLEKTKQYEELYNAAVGLGVNYAKQQAYKLKDSPDAKAKRMEWAVEKIVDLIKDFGLPEKTAKWVKDRVEAKIGENERI